MEYTVDVKYNENCEYKGSQTTERLPIITDPQEVTLSAVNNTETITIGEKCSLTVMCTYNGIPVRIGYITINNLTTRCYLNDEGKATIYYAPLQVGDNDVEIKYHDENGIFQPQTTVITVRTKKINTTTTIEAPNIIANFDETVTIKAKVTSNDNPITYGRVTFLHYLYYPEVELEEDRIEKIIGNPVYLDENGEASITYVPSQSYEDDKDIQDILRKRGDLPLNKPDYEYVRAVYNYNKNSSGVNAKKDVEWQYYEMSSDMSHIYVKHPNSVIIKAFYENGSELDDIIDYRKYIEAKNKIFLRAYIDTDQTFNDGDTITINAKGTVYTTGKTRNELAEISGTYTAAYEGIDNNTQSDTYGNHMFKTVRTPTGDISLSPGFYDFYTTEITFYINDEKFSDPIENSMRYYLYVDYNQNNNIQILSDQYSYNVNQGDSINFIITINNLTSNQLNKLKDKNCYLKNATDTHAPSYTTTLVKKNNTTLEARFQPITFNDNEDYSFYASTDAIVDGDEYIPALFTNNIKVFVMGVITPKIELTGISNNQYYPSSVQYKATINGIKNDIVVGEVYNYKENTNKGTPIKTINFDQIDTEFTYTIPDLLSDEWEYLSPGTYILELDVNGSSFRIPDNEGKYYILRSTLSHKNSPQMNNILGIPHQNGVIILSAIGNDLSKVDKNKIHIYISSTTKLDESTNEPKPIWKECQITKTTLTDDKKSMTVIFELGVYTADVWNIKLEYDDDYYISQSEHFTTFPTQLETPTYSISKDNDDNFIITVTNESYQFEYIPLIIEMRNDNDVNFQFLAITDTTGRVMLRPPSDPQEKIAWNKCNYIDITTDPTNQDIIDAISNPNSINLAALTEYDDINVAYGLYEEGIEECNIDAFINIQATTAIKRDGEWIPIDDNYDMSTFIETTDDDKNHIQSNLYYNMNIPMNIETIVAQKENNEWVTVNPSDDIKYHIELEVPISLPMSIYSNIVDEDEPQYISEKDFIYTGLRNQLIDYENTYLFTCYAGTTMSYSWKEGE